LFLAAGLAYSGVQTAVGCFHLWASDPDLFTHFEVGASEIGRTIGALPAGERVYLSPVPADHPTVVLYSDRRLGVQGYQGRFCTVAVDRAPQGASYVIAHHDDRRSLGVLAALYPQSRIEDSSVLHYGEPYFSVLRVPAGTAPAISPVSRTEVTWSAPGGTIELVGYDLDRTAYRPGEQIGLTVYWRTTAEVGLSTDYSVFVQLLGPENPATGGPLWAQDDSEPCRRGYPTSAWNTDEIVIDAYALTVPEQAPEDTYRIVAGFYEWATMVRLPVLDDGGTVVGDYAELLSLSVAASP
jgi:hypothetical protein